MCVAPSFLRFPGGAVTGISESKHRRLARAAAHRLCDVLPSARAPRTAVWGRVGWVGLVWSAA
eukprot:7386667-Prymnesium_polylepis.2